jgi:hypothetical protein
MTHQEYYYRLKKLKGKYLHYFIAGFIDSEGRFNVSFSRHPSYKTGWIINPRFQVLQPENEQDILELIRDVFKAGKIRKKAGSNVVVFSVENRQVQVEKIIPFFQKYPLATKQKVFEVWKQIVQMIWHREHLTETGYKKIIELVDKLNQQEKGRRWRANND